MPDIRAKWPGSQIGPIFIQQDNSKPHIDVNDIEFLEAASRDGFDIRLSFQPPNSLDLNVLTLDSFEQSNHFKSKRFWVQLMSWFMRLKHLLKK